MTADNTGSVKLPSAEHCYHLWELLDPNEEDRACGNMHWCHRRPGHEGEHQCVCGAPE